MKKERRLSLVRKVNPILKSLFRDHTIETMSDIYIALEKECGKKFSFSERGMVESMITMWYENGELNINGNSVSLNSHPRPITVISFAYAFRTY